jgi:hypothetical protein
MLLLYLLDFAILNIYDLPSSYGGKKISTPIFGMPLLAQAGQEQWF